MAIFGGWRLTRAGILFIIGIIVLGGLVTGGIFLVKNHGEAVRRDQAVKIAEAKLKEDSKTQTATQPVNTDTTDTDKTSTSGTDTNTDTATAPATDSGAAAGSDATALPVTGPDDLLIFGRTMIVAIVAFSVVSYIASRRAVSHL
ncbi:MAG TPA: hypothetical protein VIM37_01960 [Candidatus Microsaccharimonas sp.]|jgi:FtsZ-interacting cell division protein ZipA